MAKGKKTKNLHKNPYIVVALIIVLAVAYGAFRITNPGKIFTDKASGQSVAQILNQAEQAIVSSDKTKALNYLHDARDQIVQLPTNDKNTNTKVDIEARIYALEHNEK